MHHSPHSPGGSHGGHGGGGPHSPTSSAAAVAAAGMSHLLQVESSLRGEHPMHGKTVVFYNLMVFVFCLWRLSSRMETLYFRGEEYFSKVGILSYQSRDISSTEIP